MWDKGASMAKTLMGHNKPIVNSGVDMGNFLASYNKQKDFNNKQTEFANQQEDRASMQAAGKDYASGNDAGFRENFAKADLVRLLQRDTAQKQMDYNQSNADRNFGLDERRFASDSDYKNQDLDIKRQGLANEVRGKLSPYDQEMQKLTARNDADLGAAKAAMDEMRPTVVNALDRVYEGLETGNGTGLIGGTLANLGLNLRSDAGKNFSNVESANSQMNTMIKHHLSAAGVKSGELNAAAEARAYRYSISPHDSESTIRQKINNFKQDILGENVPQSQPKRQSAPQADPRVQQALDAGYSWDEINQYNSGAK